MSSSANPDAVSGQGEFHGKVPASEPLTTKGHAPGVLVGNEALPEFNLEVLPAGSAPKEDSYKPQPGGTDSGISDKEYEEALVTAQKNNPDAEDAGDGKYKVARGEDTTQGGEGEEQQEEKFPAAADKEPVGAEALAAEFE